jgi:catechol 2,3-dioxygenase-like lactoylglutathione lyase family enzyme
VLKGINHINIRTTDYARMKELFVEVLGLKAGWRPGIATSEGAWLYLGDLPIVHLSAADAPTAPSRGSVFDHVALEIDDYEEARRRLDALGMEYRTNVIEGRGRQITFVAPGGATLELYCSDPAPAPVKPGLLAQA